MLAWILFLSPSTCSTLKQGLSLSLEVSDSARMVALRTGLHVRKCVLTRVHIL